MEDLKRCPFCGGEVRIKSDYVIGFESWSAWCKCGLLARFLKDEHDKHEFIEAWNTRYEPTCQWLIKKSGTIYDVWSCSECGYELDENFCESRTKYNACDFKYCPNCGAKVVD